MKKTTKKEENLGLESRQNTNEKQCYNCNAKIIDIGHSLKTNKDGVVKLCNKCYENMSKTLHMQSKGINYALAIILGLTLGLIGALIWFGVVVITKWQIGLIAVAVGWLAGYGVYVGSGSKRSVGLQIISAIVALFSILIGEFLIMNHYARQYLIEEGYAITSYFLNPIAVMETVFSSLGQDPLTILFWGIAAWVAYTAARPLKFKKS
jgi:hypothetical protein|tara:strand:- start:959 stop:1582 length:624 start_codon:yes stop_codon:yes gene_type:complete